MNKFSYLEFFKHALNTPLSSILLSSQLALNEQTNKKQSLEQILLSATYIKNLLDSDGSKANKSSFTINGALVEIILLNQCFHKKIIYTKKLHQTISLKINGNKLLFQEVINCLLNNAIEAYQTKNLNKIILIKTQIKNEALEIAINDGGGGMSWLEKFLAGKKFYSLKEDHHGIGLFYAKQILKNNFQASLKLISKKHRGSTALISIPLTCSLK